MNWLGSTWRTPPPHLPDLIKTSVTLRTSAFHCSVCLSVCACVGVCEHNSITGFIMQHVMANEARDITTLYSERSLFQQPRQALVVYLWSRSWHHQHICRTDCISSSYNLLLWRPGFIRVKIIMTRNIRKFVPSVNKMPQRSPFTTNYSWCNLSYLLEWGGGQLTAGYQEGYLVGLLSHIPGHWFAFQSIIYTSFKVAFTYIMD